MSAARIAQLSESDWQLFAAVRLRALTDSLPAADPQYRQEASFTAAQWRRRLRDHAQFAALIGDRPVGLIGAQQENTETVYLYSLWLDPDARGHGLGRQLVACCIDFARDAGYARLVLWTNEPLAAARHLYLDADFTLTGEERHREFGAEVLGQSYALDLTP